MSEKYSYWVTLKPQSDRCCQGKAEVRILDFKNTWSEFQKPSQTTAEQSVAELRIFHFKTTWSEFQKPVRPLLSEAKPSYVINFKTT